MSATFKGAFIAFFTFAIAIFGAGAEPRQFKVETASLAFDARTGQPVVSFRLSSESKRDFGRLTQENVGRKMDIRVDGKTLMQSIIREPILGGSGQVAVSSAEEGRAIAARLSDGSAVLEIEPSSD